MSTREKLCALLIRFLFVSAILLGMQTAHGECLSDYDRSLFPHWKDVDGNGRDERLDAIATQVIPGTNIMHDPYTGLLLDLTKETPDVDHVIPLRAAWDRGANCWDEEKRTQFSNDPLNLIATTAGANRQKGARTIFDWIPPRLNACVGYIDLTVVIAAKYELEFTQEDFDAYAFLRPKCEQWRNGIMLRDVREWFTREFGWTY